jgi:hypothetical protein
VTVPSAAITAALLLAHEQVTPSQRVVGNYKSLVTAVWMVFTPLMLSHVSKAFAAATRSASVTGGGGVARTVKVK